METAPDGTIRTSVRDNGGGIPRDQQHLIFDRFVQLHVPGVEGHVGTGLGLWICKQLVEMNGGRIGLESAENAGSTFYFTMPAAAESESGGQPPTA